MYKIVWKKTWRIKRIVAKTFYTVKFFKNFSTYFYQFCCFLKWNIPEKLSKTTQNFKSKDRDCDYDHLNDAFDTDTNYEIFLKNCQNRHKLSKHAWSC